MLPPMSSLNISFGSDGKRDPRGVLVSRQISDAVESVMKDIRTTGAPMPVFENLSEEGDFENTPVFLRSSDGTGHGLVILAGARDQEQLVSIADQVQDWVIDELVDGVSNWPPCPIHPMNHPLKASVSNERAAWICPTNATEIAIIGGLSSQKQ